MLKGKIAAINISDRKGESKTSMRGIAELRPGWGIVGDCHAGTPGRDVSLEAFERATRSGLRVVMDRCVYEELRARGR